MLKPFGLREVVETAKIARDERRKQHIPSKVLSVKHEALVELNDLEKKRVPIDEECLYTLVTPNILQMFSEVRDACKGLGVSFVYPDVQRGWVRSHGLFALPTLTFHISILNREPFVVVCYVHFSDRLPTDDMSLEEYRNLSRDLYFFVDGSSTNDVDALSSAFGDYINKSFETS